MSGPASVLRAAVGAVALLTVLLTAFAWPASELRPRDLPVAVAADTREVQEAVGEVLAQQHGPDGIRTVAVADRAAAAAAIEDREVYGAVVVGPDGAEVLTASAAGPPVAQLLAQTAPLLGSLAGGPVAVTDVVPSAEGDPRGAVFGAGALPLALGGLLVGALASLEVRRPAHRLAAVGLAAVGAGLALTAVLQGWLGALGGSVWANAGVIALGVLAVALPVVGFHRLLGRPGIGVVAAVIMLLGNPQSGIGSAAEMLPLGTLGQLLPPGATGSALRGTAYFDGAAVGADLLVLTCWVVVGLLLVLLPTRRGPAPEHPDTAPERDAALSRSA